MVKDNSQPDGEQRPVDIHQVQLYRQLVLEYEALDEQVDALLARHQGSTEKMSDDDFDSYRQLAHQRDYVYNQMKALEQILLGDEPDSSR